MKKLSKKWKILIPSIIATSLLGASVLSACAKIEKKINEEIKNNQDNKPTNENKEKDETQNKENIQNESITYEYSTEVIDELSILQSMLKEFKTIEGVFDHEFELIDQKKLSNENVLNLISTIANLVRGTDDDQSKLVYLEYFNNILINQKLVSLRPTPFIYDKTIPNEELMSKIDEYITKMKEVMVLSIKLDFIDDFIKNERYLGDFRNEYDTINNKTHDSIKSYAIEIDTLINKDSYKRININPIIKEIPTNDVRLNSEQKLTNFYSRLVNHQLTSSFSKLTDNNISNIHEILNLLENSFKTLKLEQKPNYSLKNRVIDTFDTRVEKLFFEESKFNQKLEKVSKNINQWVYQSIFKNTDYKQDILNQFYDYFYFQSPWWNNFGIENDQQQVITKSLELRNNTINPILETLSSLFNDHLFSQMSSNYDFDQSQESKQQDENTISQFNASMKDDENSILMYQSGLFQHPITYLKLLKQTQGFGEVINEKLSNIITNLEQYRSLIKQLEFDESLTPTQVIDWLKILESTRFDALKTVLNNLKQDYDYLKQNHYQEWLLITSKGSTQSNEWFRNWSLKSMNHIDDEHSLDFIKEFKKTIVFEKTPNYNQQIKQLKKINLMNLLHNKLYSNLRSYQRLVDNTDTNYINLLSILKNNSVIKEKYKQLLTQKFNNLFNKISNNILEDNDINDFGTLLLQLEQDLINFSSNVLNVQTNYYYKDDETGLFPQIIKTLYNKHRYLNTLSTEEYHPNLINEEDSIPSIKRKLIREVEDLENDNFKQTKLYDIYRFIFEYVVFDPFVNFNLTNHNNETINQIIEWLNDESRTELDDFETIKMKVDEYIRSLKTNYLDIDNEQLLQMQVYLNEELRLQFALLNANKEYIPYDGWVEIMRLIKPFIKDNKFEVIKLFSYQSVNVDSPENPIFEFKNIIYEPQKVILLINYLKHLNMNLIENNVIFNKKNDYLNKYIAKQMIIHIRNKENGRIFPDVSSKIKNKREFSEFEQIMINKYFNEIYNHAWIEKFNLLRSKLVYDINDTNRIFDKYQFILDQKEKLSTNEKIISTYNTVLKNQIYDLKWWQKFVKEIYDSFEILKRMEENERERE